MAEVPNDLMRSLVYSLLLVLCLRAARLYAFVFLFANFGVLLRTTVQIHSGAKAAPWKGQKPQQEKETGGYDGRNVSPSEVSRNRSPPKSEPRLIFKTTRKNSPARPSQCTPSPPPYSLDPPKLDPGPRPESILQLYEDIIASDAQTIQVQQDTMSAQQDTIRAQAQMIKNMRLLLERQDERIEELEQALDGGVLCEEKPR